MCAWVPILMKNLFRLELILRGSIFSVTRHAVTELLFTVPGLMGSQLDVLDDGEDCNTGGKNESLWISEFRFIRFSCFKSEMT